MRTEGTRRCAACSWADARRRAACAVPRPSTAVTPLRGVVGWGSATSSAHKIEKNAPQGPAYRCSVPPEANKTEAACESATFYSSPLRGVVGWGSATSSAHRIEKNASRGPAYRYSVPPDAKKTAAACDSATFYSFARRAAADLRKLPVARTPARRAPRRTCAGPAGAPRSGFTGRRRRPCRALHPPTESANHPEKLKSPPSPLFHFKASGRTIPQLPGGALRPIKLSVWKL